LLKIRLARTGAKKKGSYRVVVIERERARDGRFVEILGHYNARRTPPELVLKRDRVAYWMGRGAQPSETIRSLLKEKTKTQSDVVSTSSESGASSPS
jgi:small subunit ribosomal protein S16